MFPFWVPRPCIYLSVNTPLTLNANVNNQECMSVCKTVTKTLIFIMIIRVIWNFLRKGDMNVYGSSKTPSPNPPSCQQPLSIPPLKQVNFPDCKVWWWSIELDPFAVLSPDPSLENLFLSCFPVCTLCYFSSYIFIYSSPVLLAGFFFLYCLSIESFPEFPPQLMSLSNLHLQSHTTTLTLIFADHFHLSVF